MACFTYYSRNIFCTM